MRYCPFPHRPNRAVGLPSGLIRSTTPELRFGSVRKVAVDGSKLQGILTDEGGEFTVPAGAGVYFEHYGTATDAPLAIGIYWEGVQDVPRAELIAIREAIKESIRLWDRPGKKVRVHIFSDSIAIQPPQPPTPPADAAPSPVHRHTVRNSRHDRRVQHLFLHSQGSGT